MSVTLARVFKGGFLWVRWRWCLLAALCLAALAGSAVCAAQEKNGERPRERIDDDLFRAGGSVDIYAAVAGDLFAAGGWVNINALVADNLIAAGGLIDLAGIVRGDLIIAGAVLDLVADVSDNLVAAGGLVKVNGEIGRKLFAAAGRFRLGHDASVADDLWLAVGSADVAGSIGGDALIAGGTVTIRGRIEGDLEVTALSLKLTEGARVGGSLIHRGPEPPEIAAGAQVLGEVEHKYEPETVEEEAAAPVPGWPPLFWLLMVLIFGLLFDLLLPRYVRRAGGIMIRHPFASLGLGVAILFTTPVLIVILVVSVVGLAIGIAAIAAYGTLLLVGPVIALFGLLDLVLTRTAPRVRRSPLQRRLAFIGAVFALALLGWVPYVGTPLLWLISVLGLGAASWQIYENIRAQSRRDDAAASASAPP